MSYDYYEDLANRMANTDRYVQPDEPGEFCACGDPKCMFNKPFEEEPIMSPHVIEEDKNWYANPTLNDLSWRDRERQMRGEEILASAELRRVDAQARLDESENLRFFAGLFWGLLLSGGVVTGCYWLYTLVRG